MSILFALGDPEVSAEVRAAHDAAVDAALEVLEAETCVTRRGHAGAQQVHGDGFVAAAFRHRTSRAGDPHLHTHVLVANVVHTRSDDRWTALHGQPVYHWSKTVGYLYSAELRAQLTERLGVEWGPVAKGVADIAAVPPSLIRELSTRRRDIEAMLEATGTSSGRAAQVATYATRPAKTALNMAELLPVWESAAQRHGLDAPGIEALTSVTRRHQPTLPDIDDLFVRLAGPQGLTQQRAHFGRREIIEAVAAAMPEGARPSQVLELAARFVLSPEVVALDPIRRIDQADLSEAPHLEPTRWTTVDMLRTEQRLLQLADDGQAAGVGLVIQPHVVCALNDWPQLSGEQRDMIQSVCSSGNAVDVVEGAAGAGKTAALGAAYRIWGGHGFEVIGAALSARASQQLADGSGIPSTTLDRLLNRLDRPSERGLTHRHVVVVDEAGMVGTRKLTHLLEHAQAAGAKVVLVGDHHQLPEIDAGGAFASLAQRLDASLLLDNHRQQEPWERAMLVDLRAGEVGNVLNTLIEHDRVHFADGPEEAMAAMVADWLDARVGGGRVLMMAQRLPEVERLNELARAQLQAAGEVGPDALVAGGRIFAEGDQVMALRNDYGIGILNGTRASVEAIDIDRGAMRLNDGRGTIDVPFSYLAEGDLAHGYAVTVHKAQGITVDRSLTLADRGSGARARLHRAVTWHRAQ